MSCNRWELYDIILVNNYYRINGQTAFVLERRIYMGLSWLMNDFICKNLHAPYITDKGTDYYDSLK